MYRILLIDDDINVIGSPRPGQIGRLNERLWDEHVEKPIKKISTDFFHSLEIQKAVFENYQYPIIIGIHPQDALQYFQEEYPLDLIICDQNFPINSVKIHEKHIRYGYQLILELIVEGYKIPPTIIFSDDEFAPGTWESNQVPFEEFVDKPEMEIKPEVRLYDAIIRALQKYKILDRVQSDIEELVQQSN